MGDNSELDLSGIFCGVLLIAGRAHLQIIEDSSSVGLKIELLFFAYEPPKWNFSLFDICCCCSFVKPRISCSTDFCLAQLVEHYSYEEVVGLNRTDNNLLTKFILFCVSLDLSDYLTVVCQILLIPKKLEWQKRKPRPRSWNLLSLCGEWPTAETLRAVV